MCFCATASFAASGALATVGAASLLKAKPEERPLAVIPLLFAIQQALEGAQWLVPHPGNMSTLLGYGFLFFGFLVWPAYLPFVAYTLETHSSHRRFLRWFVITGAAISATLFLILLMRPLDIQLLPKGIAYLIDIPFGWTGLYLYIIVTCGSMLASHHVALKRFGIASLASAAVSLWIFEETFTSVWCFFAALLSVFLLAHFYQRRTNKPKRVRS